MKIEFFVETGDLVPNADHYATYRGEPDNKTSNEFVQQVLDTMAGVARQQSTRDNYSIGGLTFCHDERGLYVTTDSFLDSIPLRIKTRKLPIRLVTLSDEGWDDLPARFGMRDGDPRLVVDKIRSTSRRPSGLIPQKGWKIVITGSEFDQVVGLYRCFRRGEDIELTEEWNFEQKKA